MTTERYLKITKWIGWLLNGGAAASAFVLLAIAWYGLVCAGKQP